MRILILIFFTTTSLCAFSQRVYVYGTVTDPLSEEAIKAVNVRNLSTDLLTSSNENGAFKIPAKVGDSLLISHVGYESIVHVVDHISSEPTPFRLFQGVVQLQEVEVNLLPEYWQFKQLVIDTQPMDSSLVVFGLDAIPLDAYDIPANEQKITPPDYHAPTIGIGFNLGGLTKKGKEKKKLEKLLAKQEMERTAARKFNREWVGQATKLEGDELTDFIAYCKFTSEYIVESSLFEIHQRMMALLEEFQSTDSKSDKRRFTPGA